MRILLLATIGLFACFPYSASGDEITGGCLVGRVDSVGKLNFSKRVVVDLDKDDSYGWWLHIGNQKKAVKVRQELVCPTPPATWGDLEKLGKVSSDGKSMVVETVQNVSPKGNLSFVYNIAQGDPVGIYQLKVTVDGSYTKKFAFVMK